LIFSAENSQNSFSFLLRSEGFKSGFILIISDFLTLQQMLKPAGAKKLKGYFIK
jgi:hypothetical protein